MPRVTPGSCSGPEKLMLMTRAPRSTDQSSPFMMAKVVPLSARPVPAKARTARICASGAAPSRRPCAAMPPAIAVPWV